MSHWCGRWLNTSRRRAGRSALMGHRAAMVLSVALLSALGFDSARAQTQSDPLQAAMALEPGELVAVEDDSGDRTKGRLREVTASAIVVETGDALSQRRSIPLDRIVRLSRVDGRLNGFLIGAAAAAVPGLLLGHGFNTYCNNEGPDYARSRTSTPVRCLRPSEAGSAGEWTT